MYIFYKGSTSYVYLKITFLGVVSHYMCDLCQNGGPHACSGHQGRPMFFRLYCEPSHTIRTRYQLKTI
jgi:hypothetical protein